MELLIFAGTIVGFFMVMFVVDRFLTQILRIKKRRVSETAGKKIEQWGNGIIVLVYLVTLWLVPDQSDGLRIIHLLGSLALLLGFKASLEFIYLKVSRQYILTAILLLINLFAIGIVKDMYKVF